MDPQLAVLLYRYAWLGAFLSAFGLVMLAQWAWYRFVPWQIRRETTPHSSLRG